MKKLKVVTIGGGSSYTPELVEGFIKRHEELPISELWLVDIKEGEEKLEIVGNLAKRMVKESGVNMKIYLTLDRQEALKDADFVTTQFRVGQIDARIKDEAISFKHGLIGQETNGAGGAFKALRTIPVILDITKDMEKLCPNAWLINFTNPASMVTQAVLKHSNISKVIGLCNVPINMRFWIKDIMNFKDEEFNMTFFGKNHMVWAKVYNKGGVDITEEVLEKFITSEVSAVANIASMKWTKEQIMGVGMIPCPYHQYYYEREYKLKDGLEEYNSHQLRGEVVKSIEKELFKKYEDNNLKIKPKELELRGGAHYSDAACEIINAIYNDKNEIMVVNTQNKKAISNIEYNSVIETSSIINSKGATPLSYGSLDMRIRGLVQLMDSFEEMIVEVALTGDYNLLVHALTTNPLISDALKAREVADDLIKAHKDYLPMFK